jgi:2-hydroxy-3-oxopropionate reductase
MTKPAIGFIGLGLMGSAMVERLQSLGYPMVVLANRSRANVDAAVKRGAKEAKTAKEVAESAEIVMLCMDKSTSVEARMFGPDGVIAGLSKGKLVCDFGTSLPSSTLKIAKELEKTGAHYMDTPLGRSPAHAREGKLNIMAAGTAEDFARMEPVFRDLAENIYHLGPLGAGNTAKLINNFFAMTTIVAMSEAFAMADRAGLPREKVYAVMSAGPLRSIMMDIVKAQAIDRDRSKLAFSIDNGTKDVSYYAETVEALGRKSLIAPATLTAMRAAVKDGWGDKYVAEMVDYLAARFANG